MSYPDHPAPFFQPNFGNGEGEGCGFWPQFPMNNEGPEPQSQFQDHLPPPKRLRNCEDNPPNSAPHPPMNPWTQPPNTQINRGSANIFFKTRICSKFMAGTCRNGETCKFAHGDEDMRKPPENWQELVAGRSEDRFNGNWENDERIIQKMKICKKFYNTGECPYGVRCSFLHESPSKFRNDMFRYRESSAISIGDRESSAISIGRRESSAINIERRESSAISIGTMEPQVPYGNGSDQSEGESNRTFNSGSDSSRVKPPFWKTKLCLKFESTGLCPFGEKCHFAHGVADLQLPGGHAQGEVGSVIPILPKPLLPSVANDMTPRNTGIEVSSKQEAQAKKWLQKCKGGSKKINRIYADWIDDLPLAQSLSNKVEN